MANALDDNKITSLISLNKIISAAEYEDLKDLSRVKGKHRESHISLKSSDGSDFVIKVRQNTINPLDFTVIFGYVMPNTNTVFRLKRFNGKYHEHRNKIEGDLFYDFHVHSATERYQDQGLKEDAFAEVTSEYSDLDSAIEHMLNTCNISITGSVQQKLV